MDRGAVRRAGVAIAVVLAVGVIASGWVLAVSGGPATAPDTTSESRASMAEATTTAPMPTTAASPQTAVPTPQTPKPTTDPTTGSPPETTVTTPEPIPETATETTIKPTPGTTTEMTDKPPTAGEPTQVNAPEESASVPEPGEAGNGSDIGSTDEKPTNSSGSVGDSPANASSAVGRGNPIDPGRPGQPPGLDGWPGPPGLDGDLPDPATDRSARGRRSVAGTGDRAGMETTRPMEATGSATDGRTAANDPAGETTDGWQDRISGASGHLGPLAPPDADDVPASVAVGLGVTALAGLTRTAGTSMLTAGWSLPADPIERLLRFGSAFRYSRHDDSDPLEHDVRATIHESITADPGLCLSAVSEVTEVPLSTVRHHVRVLEREGLLADVTIRGKRRLFPTDADDRELVAALSDEATAAVLSALVRQEPASVSTLASALNRDTSTVSHHLSRLADDGLVERERDGRAVLNRLAPDVRSAIGEKGGPKQPKARQLD